MKNPNHAHSVKTHFHQLGFSLRALPSLPRQTGDEKKPRTDALFLWKKIKRWNRQILHGARNLPGHGTLGAGTARTTEARTRRKNRLVDQEHGIEKRGPSGRRGAGSGYFSFRMAELVPDGKVFAVDISQMLGIVRAKMASKKVTNRRTGSQHDQGHQIARRFDRLRAYCRRLPRVLSPRNGSVDFQRSSRKRPLDPHRIPTGGSKRSDQIASQNDAEASDRGNLTSRLCLEEDPRHPAPTAFHDFRKTGCRKRTFQVK